MIPIETDNPRLPYFNKIFDPVFQTQNVIIRCQAKSIKGFIAFKETSLVLLKRSSSNPKTELSKFDISKVTNEL
jgi:hypothetical protein